MTTHITISDDFHEDPAVVAVLRRDSEFQKLLALYRRMNTAGNSQQSDGIEVEKAALVDSIDQHLGETLEELQQKLSNTLQARIQEAEVAVNNRGPIRREPRRIEV